MLHKLNRFNHFATAQLRSLDPTAPWVLAASQILAATPWVVAAVAIARGGWL